MSYAGFSLFIDTRTLFRIRNMSPHQEKLSDGVRCMVAADESACVAKQVRDRCLILCASDAASNACSLSDQEVKFLLRAIMVPHM